MALHYADTNLKVITAWKFKSPFSTGGRIMRGGIISFGTMQE